MEIADRDGPATCGRIARPSAKYGERCCGPGRSFWESMSQKKSIRGASPVVFRAQAIMAGGMSARASRMATPPRTIPGRRFEETDGGTSSIRTGPGPAEELYDVRFGVARIVRRDVQEEPVVGRPAEAVDFEERVRMLREAVEAEHPEEGREGALVRTMTSNVTGMLARD